MKKVLIISFNFPPLNSVASRRFGELCAYLPQNGWDPYVLTTHATGPLTLRLDDGHIFRIGANTQAGAAVGARRKGALSWIKKIRSKFRVASRLVDQTYFTWYRRIRKTDIGVFKQLQFDLIVASYGPGAALFAGRFLSDRLGVPWVADFRDLAALHTDRWQGRNAVARSIDRLIERHLLVTVGALTTVSLGLREALQAAYRQPVHVIYNGWAPCAHYAEPASESSDTQDYIYYAGRFYLHQIDSLWKLLEALSDTEMTLKIRSLGPPDIDRKIANFAISRGMADRVAVLPPADPDVVWRESQSAAINLVVEDLDKADDWKKGTLTGKFLPMLVQRPAILAIARDDSEIGDILATTSKGKLCSTVEEITAYLNGGYLPFVGTGSDAVANYSKQEQAARLANVLEAAYASPSQAGSTRQ